jgi:hypothetical protein
MSDTRITNKNDLYVGKVYNVDNHMLRYKGPEDNNKIKFSPTVFRSLNNFGARHIYTGSQTDMDGLIITVDEYGNIPVNYNIYATGIIPGLSKTNMGGSKKSRKQTKSKKQRKQRKTKKSKNGK